MSISYLQPQRSIKYQSLSSHVAQQYELKRIPAKELNEHFDKLARNEGFIIEPAALALIVRESGGSVRDGLSPLGSDVFVWRHNH